MGGARVAHSYSDYARGWMTREVGFDFWLGERFFSIPQCSDQCLGLPRDVKLLSMELTAHQYLVLRLRMVGAIPARPHLSSWDGAEFSTGTTSP
jgi:hypothetical protein